MAASAIGWQDHVLATRLEQQHISGDDEDDVLVIGIDFGTTFSGAAWATAADLRSDQINLITTWPGTGREEGKAPTELFYEDGNVLWGYEVPSDADPARWFKLLLLKDEDIDKELRYSEFLVRARRTLLHHNKSAEDAVADYLRMLWQHVVESIIRARGEFVVDAMTFHVVITVPAIWKDYARDRMRVAAKRAGMLAPRAAGQTTLTFAPEPEAAALSTLCEPGRRVKEGEVYLVCDAGGGTVDLSCYQIEEIEPIAMREAVEGTGGLCGGIFIDEAFEAMCKARLGRTWDGLSKVGVSEIMNGDWERSIKPQFKPGNVNREYLVSIPAEAFQSPGLLNDSSRLPPIKNGRIHFSSANIASAFSKSFRGIDALLDGQIAKVNQSKRRVTGIILVGGLGASPYLYSHLKDKYTTSRIMILQSGGMRPRTAICRGAVIKGFLEGSNPAPISVTSTISRTNIGIRAGSPFDSTKHNEADKYWCPILGEYRARNQMTWYLRKGESVPTNDPIRSDFFRMIEGHERSFYDVFWQCDDDVAPSTHRPHMRELCRVVWDLDDPSSQLTDLTHAGTGAAMKQVQFDLVLKPSGASSEISCEINGKKLGATNANIEYQ
ncbi:hypothetical protein V8F20_002295 [Naviculisporaceae sp. PSN 640]